jgi:fumarate hydratase subunit beta
MDVHMLDEWGAPEAMWVIRVKDFPAVVTMDSHGKSMHEEIQTQSKANYERLVSGE